MTPLRKSQITSAIADCNRFIAKEEPRTAHLRPADMQHHLEFCYAHRIKLLAMLDEEFIPSPLNQRHLLQGMPEFVKEAVLMALEKEEDYES
jgi:hypothetical protein